MYMYIIKVMVVIREQKLLDTVTRAGWKTGRRVAPVSGQEVWIIGVFMKTRRRGYENLNSYLTFLLLFWIV